MENTMESIMENITDIKSALGFYKMIYIQMALRAAIELKIFDIISTFGPKAQLSCAEILSKLPTEHPNASNALERVLRMLGVSSILTMSSRQCENDTDKTETAYGLTNATRYFVTDANGVSASPLVMFHSEKEITECLYMLKDAVLNPDILPVYKACHGRTFFEDISKKPELSHAFNQTFNTFVSKTLVGAVLMCYEGFEDVTELMDVGGNIGGTIQMIVSLYPNIRGMNFDLPQIIANAPSYPGVEHIPGDMFESLPKAQTIFLKWILHDWNDDQCVKILNNCWAALPDKGKVIVAEFLLPQDFENNADAENVVTVDFMMLIQVDGKERTLNEFEVLAKNTGFKDIKVFPIVEGFHIMEFIKSTEK